MHQFGVFLLLACYFVSGVGLTCFNKWLLGRDFYNFGFPITLILCHMLTNFLLSAFTVFLLLPSTLRSTTFHPSSLSPSLFLHRFAPIGVLFALDITLTNLSFQYVPVSLTEVIKGFSPAGIMLYDMAQPHNPPSLPKAFVIVLLSLGIALTSLGEMETTAEQDFVVGSAAAVGALVTGVVKFILLERLLTEHEGEGGGGGGGGGGVRGEEGGKEGGVGKQRKMMGVEVADERSSHPRKDGAAGRAGDEEEGKEMVVLGRGKRIKHKGRAGATYQPVDALDDDASPSSPHTPPPRPSPSSSSAVLSLVVEVHKVEEEMKEREMEDGDAEEVVKRSPLRRRSPPSSTLGGEVELPSLRLPIAATPGRDDEGEGTPAKGRRLPRSASTPSMMDPTSLSEHSLPPSLLPPPPSAPSSSSSSPSPPLPHTPHAGGHRRLHPMLSLLYFSPVAATVLTPAFFTLESSRLLHPPADSPSFVSPPSVITHTVLLILGGAILAFALNISELFVIQHTSALTLCVVATAKFILVVGMTTVLFGHRVTWVNVLGCGVSVVGVAAYNYLKYREVWERQRMGQEQGGVGDGGVVGVGGGGEVGRGGGLELGLGGEGKEEGGKRKGRGKRKRRVRRNRDAVDGAEVEGLVLAPPPSSPMSPD